MFRRWSISTTLTSASGYLFQREHLLPSHVVGAIALRVKGIAFAMVTLAFAQAVAITAARNPGGHTGGEEGLSLNRSALPAFLSGVVNAPYRYWLALGFLVLCVLVIRQIYRPGGDLVRWGGRLDDPAGGVFDGAADAPPAWLPARLRPRPVPAPPEVKPPILANFT